MNLTELPGISYHRQKLFNRLGITQVSDLLVFFPRKYKDFTSYSTLEQALFLENEELIVCARILEIKLVHTRSRKKFVRIKIQDETSTAYLIAFNQDYLCKSLEIDAPYIIIASFNYKYNELQASSFQIEKVQDNSLHYGRLVPFYPLTEGLTQKILREAVFQALQIYLPQISENLPSYLLEKYQLLSRTQAIENIHFPENQELLKQAEFRLKYFELFKLEFNMALKRFLFQKTKNRHYEKSKVIENFIRSLPFSLTLGQVKALMEIEKDLFSSSPMHRLLQGDVGAGKTLVALLSILTVVQNGYQAVFMVPTEVLALQQHQSITHLTHSLGIKTQLFISAVRGQERISALGAIQNGDAQIIIGTHSLFTEEVHYKNLALAVIDEQHKFGVLQRASLIAKGENPDILVMTATPIPRTLGISIFGDMDISIIPDKPAGRQKILTQWKEERDLKDVFAHCEAEIAKGHQGYIVYPLIEDSEKLDLKSATSMFEELNEKHFPSRRLVLLHGRMNEEEKERAMEAFTSGKADILVSTTVIEVGVDVKNATFIVIENAHRFGLSTLHQLRGRVGRNNLQSCCMLITPKSLTPEGAQRMKAMEEIDDGFILSQKDLELRGTGEFLGTNQKGMSELKIASLVKDGRILDLAREDAFNLVQNDPKLKDPKHEILKRWHDDFCAKHHNILRN